MNSFFLAFTGFFPYNIFMEYQFRKATEADIPAIVELYTAARVFLKQQGIDQWQGPLHPSAETAAKDIVAEHAYVLADESQRVAATASLVAGEDPFYSNLKGAWLVPGPYVTVHRVAVSPFARGHGLSGLLLSHSIALAKKAGARSVRVDTHPDNKIMQAAIRRAGFVYCGELKVYDNTTRYGYEFVL
jgi:GNAT superfamily N-acetyltransferase